MPPRFVALACLGLCVARVASATPSTDLELARGQFREFYLGSVKMPDGNLTLQDTNEASPDASRAVAYARTLREDGSWADLAYDSTARSGWPPSLHYTRMLAMVAAAHRTGTAPAAHALLDAAVHRAFAYWIAHDFTCPNWWYNQIGAPKLLATVGLLLDDELTAAEARYLTETMLPRAKIAMTGQNRIWLAGNTLMLGLLKRDEAIVDEAAAAIWDEVKVVTDEGIQPDFSFHQHGPQQQFGNYGMAFAVEICRWGVILRNTRWALTRDHLAAYRGFLLDGEAWVNWRGRMDISACGRQFMPHSPEAKARTIARVMANTASIDPDRGRAYRGFVARNVANAPNDLVGERVFWRSDYVVHRRPNFAATLKLSSRRVVGAESLNSENLLGYHLADGALYLYRRGDEYEDIFPLWDWQKLPGVTNALLAGGPPAFREIRGQRDFAGGVTNGEDGCAALDFERDGVSAKKAWFFDREVIVCLGADIAGQPGQRVITTVNQCLAKGDVVIEPAGGGHAAVVTGGGVFPALDYVEHDGWRYAFPTHGSASVEDRVQTGNWKRVFSNPDTPPEEVKSRLFTLWIDHDLSAGPQSYAYVITAAGRSAQVRFANNGRQQWVRFPEGACGVVFWTAGAIEIDGTRIAVDQPCLLWRPKAGDRFWVADPTQKLQRLNLTVNGVAHAVVLPQAGDAGRSVAVAGKL
jgi:chondroitin AC lyase